MTLKNFTFNVIKEDGFVIVDASSKKLSCGLIGLKYSNLGCGVMFILDKHYLSSVIIL